MRKLLIILLFCSYLCNAAILSYRLNGGRLGDNLHTLCRAAWLSYVTGTPLYYVPFEYGNSFAFSILLEPLDLTLLANAIKISTCADIYPDSSLTYLCHFYTKTEPLYEYAIAYPEFGRMLKRLLAPTAALSPLSLPDDCITIAMHVRKGGGFDKPLASEQAVIGSVDYSDLKWPSKFPPDEFYITALRRIIELMPDQKLYVYIFTDDPHPARIAQRYGAAINHPLLTFDYREQDNAHNCNVVQDFYAMTQFNCIIRSTSLFAKAAQLIADYTLMIYPKAAHVQDKKVIIDAIELLTRFDSTINRYNITHTIQDAQSDCIVQKIKNAKV